VEQRLPPLSPTLGNCMTTAGGSVAGLCNCLSSEELAHGSHDAFLVFHSLRIISIQSSRYCAGGRASWEGCTESCTTASARIMHFASMNQFLMGYQNG
jgi:hypothetical protein